MKLATEIVEAILLELSSRSHLDIEEMVDPSIYQEIKTDLIEIVHGRLRLSGAVLA